MITNNEEIEVIKEIYNLRINFNKSFRYISKKIRLSNRKTRKYFMRAEQQIIKYNDLEHMKIKSSKKVYNKRLEDKVCIICKGNFKGSSRRICCSEICSYKYSIIKANKRFKEWYKLNKPKQALNIKVDYKRNYTKWVERKFVSMNREEILKIIGNSCKICNEKPIEIHHKKYDNLPHNSLIEYCKFLEPLCCEHHPKGRPREKPLIIVTKK